MIRNTIQYSQLNESGTPIMFAELESDIATLLDDVKKFEVENNYDDETDSYYGEMNFPSDSKNVQMFVTEKIEGLELNQKTANPNLHELSYIFEDETHWIKYNFVENVTELTIEELFMEFADARESSDFIAMGGVNDKFDEIFTLFEGIKSTTANIYKGIGILETSYENMMKTSSY